MPLIPKPNYNQIFASQAPEQDKPAVFNNYPEGWGPESRPNNGKPTIKGFNYLQQTSDLKDLWILQNGAALPYDAAMEYAEGAVVVKDGVIQYKTADGFSPVAPEKPYILNYFTEGTSYPLNARVTLDNGDIVQSVVTGNTVDPNADMTGWFNSDLEQRGIKTYLDNFPFYIPYSPFVNDYATQFKVALESGRPIVLTQDAVYPFLTKVDATVSKGVQITGNFATLSYDGADHIGDFISIKGSTPLKHYFYALNVDGKHKATRVFYLQSGQPNTSGLSYAFFNNCHATRAKRSTEFVSLGGEAISVRGSFSSVDLEHSKFSDCILGTGAGVSGSVGIRGLGVTDLNANAYPLEMNLTNCTVDTVYSEDPAYTPDQDGVVFFGANDLTIKSIANITALTANNCWGRSIKTQCRTTIVTGGIYSRSTGTSGDGVEIGIQMGNGIVKGAVFKYSNGKVPSTCIDISATTAIGRSGLLVEGCDVILDSISVLPAFLTSYPRTSKIGLIEAKGNKVYGKARNFAALRYNGNRNIIEISGNYVTEIVEDAALENQRNFAVFRSSGTPPVGETTTAEVSLLNNINDGPEAYLVRDGVSGTNMVTTQSGRGNIGFVDVGTISGSGGQKSLVPLRATAFAGKDSSVSYSNTGANISTGSTAQLTLPTNTQLIGVQVRGQAITTVLISHGVNGGILSQIGTGAVVYSNGTTEPAEQGIWLTIWRDATDPNKINIKNNNASNRYVAVHCFTS